MSREQIEKSWEITETTREAGRKEERQAIINELRLIMLESANAPKDLHFTMGFEAALKRSIAQIERRK